MLSFLLKALLAISQACKLPPDTLEVFFPSPHQATSILEPCPEMLKACELAGAKVLAQESMLQGEKARGC